VDKDNLAVVFFVFFFIMGIVLGYGVGRALQTTQGRATAVEAGVAEYTIDPKTGETSFVYKTCK